MNETTKNIITSGIDRLDDMIKHGERVDATDLHYHLYNEDYYIVGTWEAKQELEQYGAFDAIGKIKEYETDNFGEVNTDLSDPEKVVNMLAYIIGEEALGECDHLQQVWDDGELNEDDLIAIKAELEEQIS